MPRVSSYAAIAAAIAVVAPGLALAQSQGASPMTSSPAGASQTTTGSASMGADAQAGAATPAASAKVSSGMSVKDKTGATIGQVSAVKAEASGQEVATIKMGKDTFAVDTSRLAVVDGAATVNATQAELRQMLKR